MIILFCARAALDAYIFQQIAANFTLITFYANNYQKQQPHFFFLNLMDDMIIRKTYINCYKTTILSHFRE